MWGTLSIFLADKKFTKKEQEIFQKNFGEKSTVSILSLIKISNNKIIEEKIHNAFTDASKLIADDKKRLLGELEKLIKVSDSDKLLIKSSFEKLKNLIKIN